MSVENLRKVQIAFVGESRCGKTSILRQFCTGVFDVNEASTIGIDCKRTTFRVHGVDPDAPPGTEEMPDTQVVCWDTSGSVRYREMAAHYYREMFFIGLVCDLTNINSFAALSDWQQRVRAREKDARFVVFATHADQAENRTVSSESLAAFCGRTIPVFELSASDHDTVHEAFVEAFRAIEKLIRDTSVTDPRKHEVAESDYVNGNAPDLSGALTASPAREQRKEREEREKRRRERREERDKNKTPEEREADSIRRLERALPEGDAARVLPGEDMHTALLPKLYGEEKSSKCKCCCIIC